MREGFREGLAAARERICAMAERAERAHRLAAEGFDWSDAARVARAREEARLLAGDAEGITASLVALASAASAAEQAAVEAHLGAVSRLARIGDCLDGFCESASAKIGAGLLFSDDAIKEIEDLHAETGALIERAAASFSAGDCALARRVEEEGRLVERMIERIGAAHEKRLAAGACAVRSSALFLEFLEALRGIAAHAVGLALAAARGACDV
jgi:phosphate:Na+ symporter